MTALKVPVQIGDIKVGGDDTVLFTIGLGSCVAIVVYDDEARVGGMAHAMLPTPESARASDRIGRFVTTAVPALIERMVEHGADRTRLRARLAGGASMFERILSDYGRKLGPRNVQAARDALAAAGVPVDGEDVGGTYGRSVFLTVADGRMLVTSVHHGDVTL
jgi:chemotaxis protein CheD